MPRRSLGINSGALTDSFPRCFHLSVGSSPTSGAPRAHFVSRAMSSGVGPGGRRCVPSPDRSARRPCVGIRVRSLRPLQRSACRHRAPASPWLLLARIKWLVKPSPHLPTTLCPRASFFISWKPRVRNKENLKPHGLRFQGRQKTDPVHRRKDVGSRQPGRAPHPGHQGEQGVRLKHSSPSTGCHIEPGNRAGGYRPSGGQVTPRAAFPS